MNEQPSALGVETRALTRRYAGVDVVREVSIRIPAGRKVALIGSNGAGKTTLLSVLSTLVQPTSGEAWIVGRPLKGRDAALRRSIGILRHSPMLYEALTPLENLEFFARLYDVPDAPARIEELLRLLGLWRRRHESTSILSRGTHQRLSIARALIHRPPVLLIDEPETGLDPEGVALLDEVMLRAPGVTVLAATHRVDRIEVWADGVIRLDRGRVVDDTVSQMMPATATARP